MKLYKRPPNQKILLKENDILRFNSYVNKRKESECWLYTGGLFNDKRGSFWLDGRTYKASRIAYFIATGVDPGKLLVCHIPSCNNPQCCNPNHLYLGTAKENSSDCKGTVSYVCGERQGLSKLTEKDVKKIRFLYSLGNISTRKLAQQFGVSQCPIMQIIHHKTWRHVV